MKIGDKVQFGGGEMSGGASGDITKYSKELPSRCKGPYWIVGEIVEVQKLTDDQKRAIEIATIHLSFPVTILEVKKLDCQGCFSVKLIQKQNDNQRQFTIILDDWKISNETPA